MICAKVAARMKEKVKLQIGLVAIGVLWLGWMLFCVSFVVVRRDPLEGQYDSVPVPSRESRCNLSWYGVNIAGAEFGDKSLHPTRKHIDRYAQMGMNHIRFPFFWQRLKEDLDSQGVEAFENWHWSQFLDFVSYATVEHNMMVILDSHGVEIPTPFVSNPALAASYIQFWKDVASYPLFKSNPLIMFDVLNEPALVDSDSIIKFMNEMIVAIRGVGAENLILVSGTRWSGAYSWTQDWGSGLHGRSNAEAAMAVRDPLNRFAFSLHQYFDSDNGGKLNECKGEAAEVKLKDVTDWLRTNRRRAFLTEMAAGTGINCAEDLKSLLDYVEQNSDVWMGWSWWAGGSWDDDYVSSIEDRGNAEKHIPELRSRFLSC